MYRWLWMKFFNVYKTILFMQQIKIQIPMKVKQTAYSQKVDKAGNSCSMITVLLKKFLYYDVEQ